ncbi:MAG TPA: NAD(P)H-dependent oxidoreductase [bacterium]|nr:NAD(P)H-dependent oxidoreductase [bacterium]
MASEAPAVVALCGSLRRDSFNRRLLRQAVAIARQQGALVDEIELRELALPLYDGDLEAEQGLPAGAQALKARIAAASGLLIASPEYNHSIPGTFKNAIDWATRGSNPFGGKVAALMGASTGGFGAVRSLQHLRQVLMARGAWIVPALVTVSNAEQAFDADGQLKDAALVKQLEGLVATLLARL